MKYESNKSTDKKVMANVKVGRKPTNKTTKPQTNTGQKQYAPDHRSWGHKKGGGDNSGKILGLWP